MHEVKAESHYGQSVKLDQCPECGGIWFDQYELYMPKPGQAALIESLDRDILCTPAAISNSEHLCPRDRSKLIRFNDPYFPKELIIERCPVCGGFWLNRGEFSKYQKFRQERWQKNEENVVDIKLQQDVDQILAQHQTGDATDTLGRLGKFLSTPVDTMTGQPLEPEKMSDQEKRAFDLIISALSIILRLFLRI